MKMEIKSKKPTPSIHLVRQILMEDGFEEDLKIQSIFNLKKIVECSRTFQNINLEFLLENSGSHQFPKRSNKQFLLSYGFSLVDCLGRGVVPDSKLLREIENIFLECASHEEVDMNPLVEKLWQRFRESFISCSEIVSKIIHFSKKHLEETILNWLESPPSSWDTNFYIKTSSCSPKLFRAMTAILYQVIIQSDGEPRIANLMKSYVDSVMAECLRERNDFLGLYPRDCRGLVSLLMMPPEAFPECSESGGHITKNAVGELLSGAFFDNRNRTLMLLLHYPHWLNVLNEYLHKNCD